MNYSPVKLEVFKHLFAAIADEMGIILRKASFSPNIKERRDFSCAVFDAQGLMIAQAAHIPVHLRSMPLSVRAAVDRFSDDLHPSDMIILNDPYHGGTHLPDITLVSPVFYPQAGVISEKHHLIGYVASRAHHADVGGMTPGSMPVAREIFQEGLIIPPVKIMNNGSLDLDVLNLILANVRTPVERRGESNAQIASNLRGAERLIALVTRYGLEEIQLAEICLLEYTEQLTRALITSLPDGTYSFTDYLDDDGTSDRPIPIHVTLTIISDSLSIDFSGTSPQCSGGINAVYAISLSAVFYVIRCLLGPDVPINAGCMAPVKVIAPEGTIVNALPPAAVAGGNVETSQRIVDVLLGALSIPCPDKIPAASQGTMNNISIGGIDPGNISNLERPHGQTFTYYETIGGGMGARPNSNGPSAVHSHMTNTLNTPVEALEYTFPFRIQRYEIVRGSGGKGLFNGGDGIIREYKILFDCQATILTDRRIYPPYGLHGGKPGKVGKNTLIREGQEIQLPGKGNIDLRPGDVLSIQTPGGGGFGTIK